MLSLESGFTIESIRERSGIRRATFKYTACDWQLGDIEMRFRVTLLAAFVGLSLICAAQQANTSSKAKTSNEFKVKNPSADVATRSTAAAKPVTGSASAKNLEGIERQPPTGRGTHKKTAAAVLPPERGKPNARINFKASSGASAGLSRSGPNRLAGRMKDKGSK